MRALVIASFLLLSLASMSMQEKTKTDHLLGPVEENASQPAKHESKTETNPFMTRRTEKGNWIRGHEAIGPQSAISQVIHTSPNCKSLIPLEAGSKAEN